MCKEYNCEGHCPLCGSKDIDFQGSANDCFAEEVLWKCNECGCDFKEEYVIKYCYTETL